MANNEKELRNQPVYGRGQHPNSKQNLKMFKEGDVGNPNGKPLGAIDVKNRLTKMLENVAPGKVQDAESIAAFCAGVSKVTNIDALNARLLFCAIVQGEAWAVKEIFDRIAGKSPQAIDLDLQINDWRTEAQKYGITESEIIAETKLLIAEFDAGGSDEAID